MLLLLFALENECVTDVCIYLAAYIAPTWRLRGVHRALLGARHTCVFLFWGPFPPNDLFRSPYDLTFASGVIYVLKAEIKTFDLRIGVVSHTLLSTKIRRGKVLL